MCVSLRYNISSYSDGYLIQIPWETVYHSRNSFFDYHRHYQSFKCEIVETMDQSLKSASLSNAFMQQCAF